MSLSPNNITQTCNPVAIDFDSYSVVNLVMLFFLMLGLGATIEVDEFKEAYKKPKALIIGLSCQFLFMPLVGYSLVSLAGVDQVYAISLVIMTSSPGGAMSNLICFAAQADVALSVAMTTASSLVAMGSKLLVLALFHPFPSQPLTLTFHIQ